MHSFLLFYQEIQLEKCAVTNARALVDARCATLGLPVLDPMRAPVTRNPMVADAPGLLLSAETVIKSSLALSLEDVMVMWDTHVHPRMIATPIRRI